MCEEMTLKQLIWTLHGTVSILPNINSRLRYRISSKNQIYWLAAFTLKRCISRMSLVDGKRKKSTDDEVMEDNENYCKELLFYAHVLPQRSVKPLYTLLASEYLLHGIFAVRSYRIYSLFFLLLGSKGNYKFFSCHAKPCDSWAIQRTIATSAMHQRCKNYCYCCCGLWIQFLVVFALFSFFRIIVLACAAAGFYYNDRSIGLSRARNFNRFRSHFVLWFRSPSFLIRKSLAVAAENVNDARARTRGCTQIVDALAIDRNQFVRTTTKVFGRYSCHGDCIGRRLLVI